MQFKFHVYYTCKAVTIVIYTALVTVPLVFKSSVFTSMVYELYSPKYAKYHEETLYAGNIITYRRNNRGEMGM